MRVLVCLAVGLTIAFSTPAFADKCRQYCARVDPSTCKGRCAKKAKKDQPDCLKACDMQQKMCPDACEIAVKCKKDQKCTQREMAALIERNTASEHGSRP